MMITKPANRPSLIPTYPEEAKAAKTTWDETHDFAKTAATIRKTNPRLHPITRLELLHDVTVTEH